MRYKKEEFIKGSVFHLYNRAVAKSDLFLDDKDYLY